MKHPDKWRETIDLSSLAFNQIIIDEILGYPHAGNDVFHARVYYRGNKEDAFIKVERQHGADIENEVNIMSALPFPCVPKIIDYSLTEPRYIVTKEVAGERLSMILADNPYADAKKYLSKQATALSEFHSLKIDCEPVKDRRFFHIPAQDFCDEHGLDDVRLFLISNKPEDYIKCFIHGDFHYANILWKDTEISCVLDYELSGIGIREFDMAWSVFLRPGQKYLLFMDEVDAFLQGYKVLFSVSSFYYWYINIAAHFYPFGDKEYQKNVKRLIREAIDAHRRI